MIATTTTTHQGFFYVDGIPSKGLWVDLLEVRSWDDIKAKLSEAFPSSEVDEILCSDIEGLPRHFYYGACDSFSMSEWVEFLEDWERFDHLEDEVIEAYFDNCGASDLEAVSDAYQGSWGSDEEFAQDLLDGTGELDSIPEHLRYYFDLESYARDLMISDFFESNGHYFRNC